MMLKKHYYETRWIFLPLDKNIIDEDKKVLLINSIRCSCPSSKHFTKTFMKIIKEYGWRRPKNYNQVCKELRLKRRHLISDPHNKSHNSISLKVTSLAKL